MEERLDTYVESLIFVAQLPVKREDIKYNLENALQITIDPDDLDNALHRLQEKYWDDRFAIEIVEVADGFQFMTKGAYHHIAGHFLKQLTKRRLLNIGARNVKLVRSRIKGRWRVTYPRLTNTTKRFWETVRAPKPI